MATLTLFGASGATGRHVTEQALLRGHTVRAVCRSRQSAQGLPGAAMAMVGDLQDAGFLDHALAGADGVICTLGPSAARPEAYLARATRDILAAMQRQHVTRILAVTGAMIGTGVDLSWFMGTMRTLYRRSQPALAADRDEQESLLRNSKLDWTVVKPPRLTHGAGKAQVDTRPRVGALSHISRASLAAYILQEFERPMHTRAAVVVQE